MAHRIVVLGGGYAGLTAANRLARRVPDASITLVNDDDRFVERIRLHQAAASNKTVTRALADRVRPGVDLTIQRADSIDLDRREIHAGEVIIHYDTLVYALGSTAATGGGEHSISVAQLEHAEEVHKRIPDLAADGAVLGVVGGGLTGIEAATELAEAHPGLRVRMFTSGEPGDSLSPRGRTHLRRAFDRLGINVVTNAQVTDVKEGAVVLADGRVFDSQLTVWAGGFALAELAARSGLDTDERGRVRVDATMRSLSHPEVYAVGDAAAHQHLGHELRMACATALPMANCAADAIAARLAAREATPLRFRYYHQCVSLGNRDGLIQFVKADDRPHPMLVAGRVAARYKELILRGALWYTAHP